MALTKEQTQHLYHKLLDLQKELSGPKKATESMTEEAGELSNGVDNHMADHGSLYTDRMTDQTVKEVDRELLDEVNSALQKIKDGTYGICEATGEEIPYERLDAVPYARMTVEAQTDREEALEPDAPAVEKEFHAQVKDLSNKETIDQKSSATYEVLDREQDSK
ncbi:TraR/DksA family transcriptional regulator [Bacillus atrophaeus]|uniref:TraR/DksA family transcriptional regulator n=1 Tax=Bacillus atrophaeus TaxID=1452 RepID=UPI001C62B87A|nr:TraR/DksA family transcriptional regulator [Bacillus atrophaeus]MCY8934523.1 TraR/DksA family transcriptional regulator [Bacillus atrophaeus]MCY8940508.1 TraR/DksA family transcriptional regulator [Bacillus atrophaeus]MCY8945694.1 TraR/DksA family transcriptional regulator [Bacillus atrophaeus]MCY9107305.1 TraR/DksA family transcriptional regulator [Bacillus atrophaeus]MED4805562.1 TraR/DksA family transcriptional regulator [Bacillus atrophaeus]